MDNQDTYFVSDPQGEIKIGRSYNIKERLMAFERERGSEITLLAIIPGGDIELDLHHRFTHLRIEGEWYRPEPELLDFIENLDCDPMTLSEYREANRRLGRGFKIYEHPCIVCGKNISWNHLLYPHFEDRYEHFYKYDKYICLHCYHQHTRREYLSDRLVRASCTRPLDWPKIWRLQKALGQAMIGDSYELESDEIQQPALF